MGCGSKADFKNVFPCLNVNRKHILFSFVLFFLIHFQRSLCHFVQHLIALRYKLMLSSDVSLNQTQKVDIQLRQVSIDCIVSIAGGKLILWKCFICFLIFMSLVEKNERKE